MARPRTISDEQVVDAAREVFLEQGFSATTAEIARRAGVSEGTLFKRFASKEDLFEAALGLHQRAAWQAELQTRAGQGEVRRNLEDVAMSILTEMERVVPMLTTVFARGHDPSHNTLLQRLEHPLRHHLDALASYLRAEIALGRVRPLDADLTALTLMGSLTMHGYDAHLLTPETRRLSIDKGRYVRGLLDLLWPGMAP
ncbi:TetR/AcrR family transcriptional regulator [uncultured Deinococcus sp.]|uniref:TetR/AcrR family transcriptional regulator n=1 Tax=uncultured Deinococcus sp. TaxID=158789 RepID=UPI00258B152C|nr:TetR/AcrR family transcriptional regulator [uncultured Deinococcus sp.]